MGRKVTLSRSEVEMAKHFNVPLEQVAKAKLPKRGRPVGSKNKPKFPDVYPPGSPSFEDTINEWDRMENDVNWEQVAKKQESKLSAYIQENDALATICIERWQEIQHLKYLVAYLESRNADPAI